MLARCIGLLALAASLAAHATLDTPTAQPRPILAQYASLPLRFEPRVSEDRGSVFVARTRGYGVIVSRDGARIVSAEAPPVEMHLLDASSAAMLAGVEPAAHVYRLRPGNSQAVLDMPSYERVAIANFQPGVDVVFHGHREAIEYDVIVAPGADPSRFAFRMDGAPVALDASGNLTLPTPAGVLSLARPRAYQDIQGTRVEVASAFVVDRGGIVRIRVGDYDPAHVLVIDPVVSYATYLGGNNTEQATGVAVDAAGNAYVTGYTASTDFPIVGAYDRSIGKKGDVEVFVSKLNPTGTALVWSTYIGGTSADRAVGIAVDATGSVYVAGTTSGADFPTTATAWQKGIAAGGGFVAKLAPSGNALVYSTYVASATPSSIAVDAAGNAHVAGSATPSFVTTANAMQPTAVSASGSTAFLLKLDPSGSSALFSTFLGGSNGDDATSIALDDRGNVHVGGWTTSNDFPVRNAFQSARKAGRDGFVAKLAADGSTLLYSTLLGGALDDSVNAIAVDRSGNAFVAGETYSPDFPVKDGFQMQKSGYRLVNSSVGNAFVAKLAPAGDVLVYSSFVGGEVCETACQTLFPIAQYRADAAYGIAIDADGHAYVAGIARSYTFPLVDSTSLRKQEDNQDSAFAMKVSVSGGRLLWSTFLRTGYSEPDNLWTRVPPGAASAVAVDAAGASYVVGDADSASNFQPTANAFQTASTYGPAAIVTRFAAAPSITLATSNPSVDSQTPVLLTATLPGFGGSATVAFLDGNMWIGTAVVASSQASMTATLPAGIHTLSALLLAPGITVDSPPVTEVVDVPLVCH